MFYEYNQNNSGGVFDYNRTAGISHFVIVEAESAIEADCIAEGLGIYFDGASNDGPDCSCCGDRWYPADSWDCPTETPAIYNQPLTLDHNQNVFYYTTAFPWMDEFEGFVHYKDGKVVPIRAVDETPELA